MLCSRGRCIAGSPPGRRQVVAAAGSCPSVTALSTRSAARSPGRAHQGLHSCADYTEKFIRVNAQGANLQAGIEHFGGARRTWRLGCNRPAFQLPAPNPFGAGRTGNRFNPCAAPATVGEDGRMTAPLPVANLPGLGPVCTEAGGKAMRLVSRARIPASEAIAKETDVPVRLPGHLQSDLIGDEVQPLRLQMTATQQPQDWPATTPSRNERSGFPHPQPPPGRGTKGEGRWAMSPIRQSEAGDRPMSRSAAINAGIKR